MKKKLFTAVFFVLSAFFLNAEKVVIDWQGSDEGISYEPAWLSQFLNKKKDEKLRDFFSLKKNDLYFIGIEENIDLEMAKNTARTNAVKQASEKLCTECGCEKDSKVRLNGLELKYSFWQEIAEENDESSVSEYKAFCIYTITAENWKSLIKLNQKKL